MPLHRTNHPNAPKLVEKLEKEGEVVTAIASDDSGVYIATRPVPKLDAAAITAQVDSAVAALEKKIGRKPGEKETRA